ncbi:MAG: ABC transporter substrate-binding protein, partial [Evtepia sp.]
MKKLLALLLTACMCFTLLTACGDGSSGKVDQAAAGKTIVIGAQTDLNTLDPGNMYEPYANMVSYAAYDMLYSIKTGTMGTPEPSIAKDVTIDETGKIYTFHLRDDVVFSSGNKLTANDVVWSVNRVLNMPESNAYANMKIVKSVKAVDDYTVEYTLHDADASFLVKLTSNAYCVLDSAVVKEHGGSDKGGDTAKEWLNSNSAGSGPYIIEKWTPKEQLILQKNPNYWGDVKNIDTLILKEMTSVDAQITALKNGEIDIALGLNSETAKQLEGVPDVAIKTGSTAMLTFLVMSRDAAIAPELSNPKVQEAVRYALDYKGYLALGGEGCTIPMNIVQQGFSGALQRDEGFRDVEKA